MTSKVGPSLRLSDARDIRALAHPARMAIINALATGEELTATECATLTGLSPSATAYHLKLLERYDYAERAPARADGRDRPWRATGRQRHVELDPSTAAGAAAAAAIAMSLLDRSRALAVDFIATEHEEPKPWRDVAAIGTADLWLTAAESRRLAADLAAVVAPYRSRRPAERPKTSRPVRVTTMVFPEANR